MEAGVSPHHAMSSPPAWLPLSPGDAALASLSDDGMASVAWLLSDAPEAAAPSFEDSRPTEAPRSATAQQPAPPEAPAAWRCLDPTHAASCSRCVLLTLRGGAPAAWQRRSCLFCVFRALGASLRVPLRCRALGGGIGRLAQLHGREALGAPRAPQLTQRPSVVPNACRCLPAPPPASAGRYRLTDASGALTEKRLRSLLSRCPEWNDAGERERLAAALEAEEAAGGESSGAAEVLRSHSCADMRKHAMLCLAFRWRYRGDCWSERAGGGGERKRTRQRPAGADNDGGSAKRPFAAAAAQAPEETVARWALADRTLTVSQAAQAQVHGLMVPLIRAAARAWTGPHSAVQYGRARGAGMTWARVRTIEGALEVSAWLRDVYAQRMAGLRSWREALSDGALRQPAYLCDAAFVSPESELEALRYILSQSRASTRAFADRCREADGGLLPQHAAWVHDFDLGHQAVLGLVGAACSYVAAQRMESLRTFLHAAEAVLASLRDSTACNMDALQQRVDWTSEAAAAQGAAAGCRLQARAALPPLVQRLRLTGDNEHGARLLALASQPPPRGAPLPPFVIAGDGSGRGVGDPPAGAPGTMLGR